MKFWGVNSQWIYLYKEEKQIHMGLKRVAMWDLFGAVERNS